MVQRVESQPPEKNPLAAAHPRALRACRWLRVAAGYCCVGAGVGCLCFIVPPVGAAILGLCFSLAALLILVRSLIVVLFFSRYSLRDMLAWTLSVGAFMTVIAAAPGGWKLVGVIGLGSVVGWSIIYLMRQDPEGEAAAPPFIAQALRARKLRAIREQREKRKGQEPPRAGPPDAAAGDAL